MTQSPGLHTGHNASSTKLRLGERIVRGTILLSLSVLGANSAMFPVKEEYWEEGDLMLRIENAYDSCGHLQSECFYSGGHIHTGCRTWEYSEGKQRRLVSEERDGSIRYTIDYEHFGDTLIVATRKTEGTIPDSRTEEYYQDGLLVIRKLKSLDSTSKFSCPLIVYDYDSLGRLLSVHTMTSDSQVCADSTTYEYNLDGLSWKILNYYDGNRQTLRHVSVAPDSTFKVDSVFLCHGNPACTSLNYHVRTYYDDIDLDRCTSSLYRVGSRDLASSKKKTCNDCGIYNALGRAMPLQMKSAASLMRIHVGKKGNSSGISIPRFTRGIWEREE